MKRVKITVAYDGTGYCGWQLQPNGITIEEVLNKALSELLKEPIAVIGASRTDSGVHAEGNVAVFDTENRMPAGKICFAVNQRLPEDVRVLKSEEVAPDYHPRKCNCIKTYEYQILNRKIDMPTLRLYSHFCYLSLDVEKMKEGARYLVGEHDFKSFCTVRTQTEETVRTIYSLDIKQSGDMITLRISGSGFLYNMVRIIAGTLIKVGTGAYPPEHVEEILDARDRNAAGPKAAARGLTLKSLEYETALKPVITGKNKYWKYRLVQTEIASKKKAYLLIDRCVEEEFDSLLKRMVHQAYRNGAKEIYICDREGQGSAGRIVVGKQYGYYSPEFVYDFVKMIRNVSLLNDSVASTIFLKSVDQPGIPEYVHLLNELFFDAPNACTVSEAGVRKSWCDRLKHLFFIQIAGENAGIAQLEDKRNGEVELTLFGLAQQYRGAGISKAALKEILGFAGQNGFTRISLLVCTQNKKACALYRQFDFREVETDSRWFMAKA